MSAAPIIVSALFGREDQAFFDAQRAAFFPPERNVLLAHLTMFHHLPPSIEQELGRRLAEETRGVPAPAARLAGLRNASPSCRPWRNPLAAKAGCQATPTTLRLAAIRGVTAGLSILRQTKGWKQDLLLLVLLPQKQI